jgi:excisionase family DNA binding protein
MAGPTPKEGKAQRDLIPVRAVAKRLGLSETHVYLMAQRGQIPCVKFAKAVRFDPADVDAFIRAHRRRRKAA